MNKERILSAAIDCVTRFRAAPYPLKNVCQEIIRARRLNSGERKVLIDLVFHFSREVNLLYLFFEKNIQFAHSMTVQAKDALSLELLFSKMHVETSAQTKKLCEDYALFVQGLKEDRYLLSLGPVVQKRFIVDYKDEAKSIAKGLLERPAKYLAVDRRFVSVDQVMSALTHLGVLSFRHKILPKAIGIREHFDLSSLPAHIKQHVWLMDAGSQIIAELINPKAHETVLDLCVGEGNKAHYICMRDCHYVALDIDETRLKKAKRRISKKGVEFVHADGRNPPLNTTFDWILLDAPCSGVGVLRRNPDLLHRLNEDSIRRYVELQKSLLVSAIKLLAPGGVLVYATCSLFREENDRQIAQAFAANSQLRPIPLSHLVGEHLNFNEAELSSFSVTLFPHIHDCDGFYFACLTKIDRQ